jgi:microcystin-dependent protein
MSDPYVGEIRMFGGNFAPAGWAFCNGQTLPISENETLFQLIGTTYGGDGQETFGLPDLQGRLPVHQGAGLTLGEAGGVESVTLTTQQMPTHNHTMLGSTAGATSSDPTNAVPASLPQQVNRTAYGLDPPPTTLSQSSLSPDGGSQPHDNMMPYLAVSFIISLFGIFPPQN